MRIDLSYLLVKPMLDLMKLMMPQSHWYSINPSWRYIPEKERERELALAGIDDATVTCVGLYQSMMDWPANYCYKLVLAMLMPGQTLVLVVHRHG